MNSFVKMLIITRPYSWGGIILLGILANVIATKGLVLNADLTVDVFTALLIWSSSVYILEFFHKKVDSREPVTLLLPAVLIFILVSIMAWKNALTLLFSLLVIIVSVVIYSSKIKKFPLSGFSFMFRGLIEVNIFLIILFFHSFHDINSIFPVLLAIYFMTNSRNLIGDIRDVEFDKYTFPKKYGVQASYVISTILLLLAIFNAYNFEVTFPLIAYILVLALSRDAYFLHRIFVVTTIFFYANYILFVLNESIIVVNILFVSIILTFTYSMVPRKSNSLDLPKNK